MPSTTLRSYAALALLAPALALGQALPLGDPFPVNSASAGEQNLPDVAADGADGYRFVWATHGGEPAHWDVRTRRLQANGALGTDSLLSQTTTNDQSSPRVDMSAGGDWIAIWKSDQTTAGTDEPWGRGTTSGGTILEAEFAFATEAGTDAATPDVAAVDDDYLVGSWRNDGGGASVRGNFRSRAGVNWGVSAVAASASGTATAVEGLYGDAWAVAWHAADADQTGAWVRCHELGTATESASPAQPVATGAQAYPDLGSDDAFRFVVVYQEDLRVFARLFGYDSGTGACDPMSDAIPVSDPEDPALYPRVAMARDGAFVVAWYENTFDADNGVAAREFFKDGTPAGPPFAVHAATLGAQSNAAVAISAGTFAVVWTTPDSGAGGDRNVVARRFQRRVMSLDFTAWSDDAP